MRVTVAPCRAELNGEPLWNRREPARPQHV